MGTSGKEGDHLFRHFAPMFLFARNTFPCRKMLSFRDIGIWYPVYGQNSKTGNRNRAYYGLKIKSDQGAYSCKVSAKLDGALKLQIETKKNISDPQSPSLAAGEKHFYTCTTKKSIVAKNVKVRVQSISPENPKSMVLREMRLVRQANVMRL